MRPSGALFAGIVGRYRVVLSKREVRTSAALSIIFFFASVVVSFYAINHANEVASSSVTDLVLSNTPAFDVDALFTLNCLY